MLLLVKKINDINNTRKSNQEVTQIISRFPRFILQKLGIKFDVHKLKKFNDLGFVIIEKIIIKLEKFHPLYLDFYEEITENEIKLANISENDKILHVGCGSFPATSIILAKKTGAKITCIDINNKSVKQAQIFVSKYNLSDQIEIKNADANQFPVENFDLILLSQGIKPHKKILKNISQTIKPNTRVIFRTTCNIDGNLCQNDMFLNELFEIVQIEYNKKNGLLISILLNKK